MSASLTIDELKAVLDETEKICLTAAAGQENPVPKLSSLDHRKMAEFILTGPANGFIALDHRIAMLLIWSRDADRRYRLTLSSLYNQHSWMIAKVHEYFIKQRLMDWMNPASYQ